MKKTTPLLFFWIALLFTTSSSAQTFDIYVSDGGNFNNPPWQILKFDENGDNPEVFINENLAWPQDILFLEDQEVVLISNLNTGRITKYEADSGQYLEDFATGIGGPTRMKIGPDSLLYVLQWAGNGKVKRYELDGTFVDDFTSIGVPQSIGIAWDKDGNLYVSSWNGAYVQKFDVDGNDMGTFTDEGLQGPTNVEFNAAGELLVANWSGTTIKRYDASGNFIDNFITGLSNPEGIAFYPNGNILVGNGGTSAVKLFDSDGNFIEDIVSSGSGNLILPNAVVLREASSNPVSVTEVDTTIDFIQPSVGTVFYFDPVLVREVESLAIYSATGILLESKQVVGQQVWDAGNYPEGMYLISAETQRGKRFVQKIIVNK